MRISALAAVLSLSAFACTAQTGSAGSADEEARAGHASATSDLATDLAKPAGPLGTPFTKADEKALPKALVKSLKSLVAGCVEERYTIDPQGTEIDFGTFTTCPQIKSPDYDKEKLVEKTVLDLDGTTYTAVAWDGDDSDGGDETDLAIYDADGKRIAVYKAFYSDSGVLSDLASVAGVTPKKSKQPFEPKSQIERDELATQPFSATDAFAADAGFAARLAAMLEGCAIAKAKSSCFDDKGDLFINPKSQVPGVVFGSMDVANPDAGVTGITGVGGVPLEFYEFVAWQRHASVDVAFYKSGKRIGVYLDLPKSDTLHALAAAVGANLQ
jgi:hypothetical protein